MDGREVGTSGQRGAPGRAGHVTRRRSRWPRCSTGDARHAGVRRLPYDQQPYWDMRAGAHRRRRARSPVELVVNGRGGRPQDGGRGRRRCGRSRSRSRIEPEQLGGRADPAPSSHTNPVFVLVGGQPIRASRRSARVVPGRGQPVLDRKRRRRSRPRSWRPRAPGLRPRAGGLSPADPGVAARELTRRRFLPRPGRARPRCQPGCPPAVLAAAARRPMQLTRSPGAPIAEGLRRPARQRRREVKTMGTLGRRSFSVMTLLLLMPSSTFAEEWSRRRTLGRCRPPGRSVHRRRRRSGGRPRATGRHRAPRGRDLDPRSRAPPARSPAGMAGASGGRRRRRGEAGRELGSAGHAGGRGDRSTICATALATPAPAGGGHRGIDIFAPRWTEVVAVTEGTLTAIAQGGLAGRSLWLVGDDGRSYFYGHLQAWARGI